MQLISIVLLLLCVASCSIWSDTRGTYGPVDPETDVPRAALPATAPTPHTLRFTESSEEGHLRPTVPSESTPISVSPSIQVTMTLSPAEEVTLRQAALQDQRVRDLLGERYAFIEASLMRPDWKTNYGCCERTARLTKLVFYSYSNNVAIEVHMKADRVAGAERREGYLPPEGDQEIQDAIELARHDARLANKLQGLQGRALLMEPESGIIWNDPGYGHRVLWVTFERNESGDPEFWAIVDLSDQKVLDAGAESKS